MQLTKVCGFSNEAQYYASPLRIITTIQRLIHQMMKGANNKDNRQKRDMILPIRIIREI